MTRRDNENNNESNQKRCWKKMGKDYKEDNKRKIEEEGRCGGKRHETNGN